MRKTRVILSMEHGDTENDIKRRHRAKPFLRGFLVFLKE